MTYECCQACHDPDTRKDVLRAAARHPPLAGSRLVGSRGVRNLFVCRECGAMWRTWTDQREGYRCWATEGSAIVPVFAADTDMVRLVDWIGTHYLEKSFTLVNELAKRLLRRKPEGLDDGVDRLLDHIDTLCPPAGEAAAQRSRMLFHLLGMAALRAARGDLRPPGPRVKPPVRYRDAEVEAAAKRFQPRELDGLVRMPLTHDAVRRMMWEARRGPGPTDTEKAVITIRDPAPVTGFLEGLPLGVLANGTLRGIYAEAAFDAAAKVHDLGRLPENDHAICMPRSGWAALEALLDPLRRLADSWRRILAAADQAGEERSARLQMESLLVRKPIRMGARFTDSARLELEKLEQRLQPGTPAGNDAARTTLREILELEQRGRDADRRCVFD